MKSYWIIGVLLLPCILTAQGWKENFDELKTSEKPANGKWIIGSGDLTMTRNNRSFELVRLKGTPVASKYIPYDFTGPVRYLQIRVIECTARVLPGTGLGPLLDWIRFQPGLYTIPVYADIFASVRYHDVHNLSQPSNAPNSLAITTLSGIITLVSSLQFANAHSPILVTLLGIVTLVRPLQP